MKRVVITGMGALTPIGNNVEESWNGILNQKCGVDEITYFDTSEFKIKLAAELKELKLEDYLDFKEIKNNDKFISYAKVAAKEAMKDSKLDLTKIDHDRFGVIIASGIGGLETIQDTTITMIEKGNGRISPFFIPKSLINLASGNIAIDYNANGYVTGVVTACAAGTNAIGDAYLRIKYGFEDVIITGGSEASICKVGVGGFQAMKALNATTNKNRASIPFDKERSGFVMGEGAGILILEELEHALNRGADIIAEVVGYGCSCDANHITAPLEDGRFGAKAMINAINDANIKVSDIQYINAHGTSTYLNDMTETKAIKITFKDHANKLMVSSTKSNTGHLLGASGAVEAIFTALALKNSVVPPTINYQIEDENCDLDIVPNELRKVDMKYAMSNSLGFGGHNATIILKKWEK